MAVQERSPAQLLLEAVDTLPAADRQRVLVWLLDPVPGPSVAAWGVRAYAAGLASRIPELPPRIGEALRGRYATVRGEELQTVPVRLTTQQHAALRTWCEQHGFSMATVIRGLVAKFLDDQNSEVPPAQDAAQPPRREDTEPG